jgi:hypothetical protein
LLCKDGIGPFRFSGRLCYTAAMKPRHAAALALVGWYLNSGRSGKGEPNRPARGQRRRACDHHHPRQSDADAPLSQFDLFQKVRPAMAAGVADRLWSIEELIREIG